MKNRKNQTAVMTMATVLSVTAIASPLSIMAQEYNPAPPTTIVQENGQQKTAPNIILPENLQAIEGTTLKDVSLPDNWTWADESTIITAESSEYPARFHVDATSFDYSNIEGYSAEGNYVERMVTVTVEPAKKETTEPIQGKSRTLRGNMPTTYSAGDIAINVNNFPDEAFRNWLELQTYGQDKIITQAEIAAITKIDVSNNINIRDLTGIGHFTALTELYCYATGITSLDVSQNTNLIDLDCNNTGITTLDVSQNKSLNYLYCDNTGITSLDVSQNKSLNYLYCDNTGITSLDVSQNTNLTYLQCYNTPLAYLNIGTNNNLDVVKHVFKPVNVEITGDTFNMANQFEGIDLGKIRNVKGANYQNGIMSNYGIGTSITYTYDCGTSKDGAQTIDVTLHLMGESTISIKPGLDKTYDGSTVSETPAVNKTGSSGTVSYKWERKKNGTGWEPIASAPKDAGTYRVTATLASDNNYTGKTSVPLEFTISQAVNDWTEGLSIKGWTFDKKPNSPTAKAKFGTITYTYNDSVNGTFTDKAPTNAGTWYVKATVAETENYTGLKSIKSFTISQADNSWTEELSIKGWNFDEKPNAPTAKAKFGTITYTYSDSATGTFTDKVSTKAGTWYVKATVAGTKNYSSLESIKSFTITQTANSWTEELSIKDWRFDEKSNAPTAKAKYGTIIYTYSDSATGTFTDEVPTNAGTWYVKATVAETENYTGLKNVKSFTISQADNSWTEGLSIKDWTFNGKPNAPTAKAKYGTITYAYSDSATGTFTDEVPTNAGTWYVKAIVKGTENYEGLESDAVSFIIAPKDITLSSQITMPEITADTNLDELVIKDGEKVLVQGTDYDITKTQDGNKGIVTITFKKNYTGKITKTFTVDEKTPSSGDKDNNKSDGTISDNQNASDKITPQTGDNNKTGLFTTISLLSAGLIAFLTGKKEKIVKNN